jgi:hypothetical protein
VDWFTEASVSEKLAVSIFRAEVTMPINQPIKNLTKADVLYKCKTSSLARLDHSCV